MFPSFDMVFRGPGEILVSGIIRASRVKKNEEGTCMRER
jgi:hypothetical protein